MRHLEYKRLKSVANSVTPYRGTTNRFPIGNRRENHKYFLVGEEEGKTIFNIVYGQRYERNFVTKEEYDEYLAHGKTAGHSSDTGEYFTWEKAPNFMGVVRSDNSFEFTAKAYYQGERGFLSQCSEGWFYNESRRGGMLYTLNRGGGDKKMYSIYHGMRVDCNTMKPLDEDIVITGKTVNRKQGKDLLKQYGDFYKICEVMCKSMDGDTFGQTATSIYNEYKPEQNGSSVNGWDWLRDTEMAFALADSLIHQAPFDSLILYALALDVYGLRWTVRHGSSNYSNAIAPMNAFEATKRKLNKHLYKKNADVFKPVQYAVGEHLPASEWGYTITVSGVEVEQY